MLLLWRWWLSIASACLRCRLLLLTLEWRHRCSLIPLLLLLLLSLLLLQTKLLLVLLHQPILMGILLQELLLLGIEAGLVLLQILEHLQLLLVEIEVRQGRLWPAILLLETLVRCCCCIISGELSLIIQFAYSMHCF